MAPRSKIQQDFIQDFGEGYRSFGLSRLMGHVVGLLLFERGPLSLDDIAGRLQVSKGPVSQITRRLSEGGLIRKVWIPGSRRVHYEAEEEIFDRAFSRHAGLLAQNRDLAGKYRRRFEDGEGEAPPHFRRRVEEMYRFYELMAEHLGGFLETWRGERRRLAAVWEDTGE